MRVIHIYTARNEMSKILEKKIQMANLKKLFLSMCCEHNGQV